MINIYLQEKKIRENRKNYKDNVLFGMLGGVFLAFLSFMQFLRVGKGWDILWAIVFVFAILLFMIAIIYTPLVEPIKNGFMKVGNAIGNLVFKLLLIIMYITFFIPAGKLMDKRKYEFYSWETGLSGAKGFIDREMLYNSDSDYSDKNISLYRVISFFMERRQFVMLPALVILLVLGIVLFFLSSTVVAPFIYTLF